MNEYKFLQEAIISNDIKLVESALKKVSDVNEVGGSGINVLHYYISVSNQLMYKPEDIISMLIKFGVDINAKNNAGATPLHFAISTKKINIVEALLKHSIDIDSKNSNGNSALWNAVQMFRGEKEVLGIVKLLVSHGADPKLPNNSGHSPESLVNDMHESMSYTKKPREWDLKPLLNWS